MSKEKLNFLLQIQILHFKYVLNFPSLSLAWFFLIQNELRTMCQTIFYYCVPTRIIIPSAIPAYLQVHTVHQDVVVRKVVASYLFLTDPIPFNFVIVPVYRALTGV